jgi:hypothetical protein
MNDFEIRELYEQVQEMKEKFTELIKEKRNTCRCCMED